MITRTNARLYYYVIKKHPKKLILFEGKLKRRSLHIVKNILAHRCREWNHNTLNGKISNKRNNKINLLRKKAIIVYICPVSRSNRLLQSSQRFRTHIILIVRTVFSNENGILFCKLRITWTNKKRTLTQQTHAHDCLFNW